MNKISMREFLAKIVAIKFRKIVRNHVTFDKNLIDLECMYHLVFADLFFPFSHSFARTCARRSDASHRSTLVGNSCARGITSIYISVVKERHGACTHACEHENLCAMRDQQQPPASSSDTGLAHVHTRTRCTRARLHAYVPS